MSRVNCPFDIPVNPTTAEIITYLRHFAENMWNYQIPDNTDDPTLVELHGIDWYMTNHDLAKDLSHIADVLERADP